VMEFKQRTPPRMLETHLSLVSSSRVSSLPRRRKGGSGLARGDQSTASSGTSGVSSPDER
jgi:hypothetical protein